MCSSFVYNVIFVPVQCSSISLHNMPLLDPFIPHYVIPENKEMCHLDFCIHSTSSVITPHWKNRDRMCQRS